VTHASIFQTISTFQRGEGKVQPVDQFGSHRSSPVAACCTSRVRFRASLGAAAVILSCACYSRCVQYCSHPGRPQVY
jgi:hypothetical protein